MVLLLFGYFADPDGRAHRAGKIVESKRSFEQRYGSVLGIFA